MHRVGKDYNSMSEDNADECNTENFEEKDEEDSTLIPLLSDYSKKLDSRVKRRYIEKISMIGIDPATLWHAKLDPECLPPIEASDLLSYLVLDTSYYTAQQFKAFKSLEAYNHMVSGFITCVQGKVIAGKYVVLAKVRHSQRMNDPPIPIWVIASQEGTIISAHCMGCKAGLAETCSHVASVLFYIEAWTRIHGKLACTQVKCTWLLPTYVNEVPYARARDINFKSAKKLKEEMDHKIDACVDDNQSETPAPARNIKASNMSVRPLDEEEMNAQLKKLNDLNVKPVILSLFKPYSERFISRSQNIVTMPHLYDPSNLNLSYPDLLKQCFEVKLDLTDSELDAIEADTRKQSKSNLFFRHRAGRIGASVCWAVAHSNPMQPSQSLIKSLCYPHLFKVTLYLYDSLFYDIIANEVEEQLKDLMANKLTGINIVPVQQQGNGSDCGVFSIAFATCIVYGRDPGMVTFDVPQMRPHLSRCLKTGVLSPFPQV